MDVECWEEANPEVIARCFIEIHDPFAREEELGMETLLSKISTSLQDLDMSSFDDDGDAYEPLIDTSSPNWGEKLHSEIVEEVAVESDDEASDDFDVPLKTLEVNSGKGALGLNEVGELSDWQGNKRTV